MKFSIRDLVWLTILVGMTVAWWLDHRAGSARERRLEEEIDLARHQALNERVLRVMGEAAIAGERTRP